MTKIDIFSGFLGAGKTTLIKKLIREAYAGEKLVLIENEFGEIGIDGAFLQDAGIEITEMNSGCICCSLVGDFSKALVQVLERFSPDRILIEPSGVGKLSDVINAVQKVGSGQLQLNSFTTVADANKVKLYMRNFGEFYNDQVSHASAIVLSRTAGISEEKLAAAVSLLREKNPDAVLVTTPWDELDGMHLLAAIEHRDTLAAALELLAHEHHHEHHHEDGCDCPECHDHHHEHEHHHEDGCDCPECHDHHHEHEHEHHHHHDHHHADDVFTSYGFETTRVYTKAQLDQILSALDSGNFGTILRAKGILPGEGGWLHFDYVPEEHEVRPGSAGVTGRICVIGAKLNEKALSELFG